MTDEKLLDTEKINYELVINEMKKFIYHVDLIVQHHKDQMLVQALRDEISVISKRHNELIDAHNAMHHLNNKIKVEYDLYKTKQDILIAELQTQLAKKECQ